MVSMSMIDNIFNIFRVHHQIINNREDLNKNILNTMKWILFNAEYADKYGNWFEHFYFHIDNCDFTVIK